MLCLAGCHAAGASGSVGLDRAGRETLAHYPHGDALDATIKAHAEARRSIWVQFELGAHV